MHPQRVSFDTVVKAVDIYQDPSEYSDTTPRATTHVPPISEEPTSEASETKDEGDRHQYTVPLNDTQPREGPTLLQQLKSVQFHGGALPSDQWGSTRAHSSNKDEKTEGTIGSTRKKLVKIIAYELYTMIYLIFI